MQVKKPRENIDKVAGERLKRLRLISGLSRGEFAKLCNYSAKQIGRLENGAAPIRINFLPVVARALRLKVENVASAIFSKIDA